MTIRNAKPISEEVAASFCKSDDFHLPVGTAIAAWYESLDHKHMAAVLFHTDEQFWGFLVVRRGPSRCEPEHVGRGMLSRESVERVIDAALASAESRPSPQTR